LAGKIAIETMCLMINHIGLPLVFVHCAVFPRH